MTSRSRATTGKASAAEALRQLIDEANALAQRMEWRASAEHYVVAAGRTPETEPAMVAALYRSAGEGFRRADAPRDAMNALQLALAHGADEGARISLAAVLIDLGMIEGAQAQLEHAGDSAVAIDLRVSLLLATGTADRADSVASQLPAGPARRLREAQIQRMSGALGSALSGLLEVEAELSGGPGVGAVRAELGETYGWMGRTADAVEAFEAAAHDHREAGRDGSVWRTLASHVWALLDAGVPPVGLDLSEGVRWAEQRGLSLLALDLQIPHAAMTADLTTLQRARDRALEWGLRSRAGRAELARCAGLKGAQRLASAEEASRYLIDHRPLWMRARLLQAEALSQLSPAGARRLLDELVIPLQSAQMAPELERLRALESACSTS